MMNYKVFLIFFLLMYGGACLAQQEVIYPVSFNPALYQYKHQADQSNGSRESFTSKNNVIFKANPLSLPFIDDFSKPTTRPYKLENGPYADSGFAYGPCLSTFSVRTTSTPLSLTQGRIFVFNPADSTIDSSLLGPAVIPYRYYTSGANCFAAFTTQNWYSAYYRLRYNDTTFVLDSVLVYDTIIESAKLYFSNIPDSANWMDNYAWVNTSFPKLPPSIGAATMDGLNEFGLPYDKTNPNRYGVADFLTSKPIDLSGLGNGDSVYISFYYQAMGYGNWPNYRDSILLEIRDKNDRNWYTVWRDTGFSNFSQVNTNWKQAIVYLKKTTSVLDPDPFYNEFQFRFKNYASLGGNNDHWNIDYVKLDRNRSLVDTSIQDIGISEPIPSIVKTYSRLPWKQFNPTTDLVDNISVVTINNNPSITPTVDWQVSATELNTSTPLYSSPTLSFPADALVTRSFNPSVDYVIPTLPSGDYIIRSQFASRPSAGNLITSNDTVYSDQYFDCLLGYDDGSAERGYGLEGLGIKQFAYEYNLLSPDTISAIQFMFTNIDVDVRNLIFNLRIWDSISLGAGVGGVDSIILELENAKPHYIDSMNGWTTYVLPQPILVKKKFFIGWSQTDLRNIQLGLDMNSSKGRSHMFVNFGAGWDSSFISLNGSPMIRVHLCKEYNGISTAIPFFPKAKPTLNVTLYPNPVENTLYIQGAKGEELYEVIDVLGKTLLTGHYKLGEGIHCETLPASVYYVRISDSNGVQNINFIKR